MKEKIVIGGAVFTHTFPQRFWSKVLKVSDGECWNWTGAKQKRYGCIYPGGPRGTAMLRAHRISYMIHFGPIKDGLHVLHKCDNPLCVNPNHLFLGTARDNTVDAKKKGRLVIVRGEKNGRAKFTQRQVDEIKRRLKSGRWGIQSRLAREYHVPTVRICQIANGYSWK